jgi:hypothetical protein
LTLKSPWKSSTTTASGGKRGPTYRQHLDDGWWYHVRVYWPPMHVRLLFVRYPDQVRKRGE